MTVASQDYFIEQAGDGGNTDFPYTFMCHDEEHLEVQKTESDGTQTILTLNVDYTVTGIGNRNGGNVDLTLHGAPLATDTITITRVVPVLQAVDLLTQGVFDPSALEKALDLIVMMIIRNDYFSYADAEFLGLYTTATLPIPSAARRWRRAKVADTGAPDRTVICMKGMSGTYSWVNWAMGGL